MPAEIENRVVKRYIFTGTAIISDGAGGGIGSRNELPNGTLECLTQCTLEAVGSWKSLMKSEPFSQTAEYIRTCF